MTGADQLALALLGLMLGLIVWHALRSAYRRANPRRRPVGSLTSVGQGRSP